MAAKSKFRFHFTVGEDMTLKAAVAQAVGYASTCWSPDGVFMSELASDCVDQLVDFIEDFTFQYASDMQRDQDERS